MDDLVVALSEQRIAGGGFDSISNVCILLAFRLRSIPNVWCFRRFVAVVVGLLRLVVELEVQSCNGTGSNVCSNNMRMDSFRSMGTVDSERAVSLYVLVLELLSEVAVVVLL